MRFPLGKEDNRWTDPRPRNSDQDVRLEARALPLKESSEHRLNGALFLDVCDSLYQVRVT